MKQHLALAAQVVRDYDEAITWYTERLGFELVEDSLLPDEGKRWVVFVREPLLADYGTVAVLRDLYGNLWDLLEPRT